MSAALPPGVARARTAPELLVALATADATRPRLTWYDDHPGPTRGERIELSARVLVNWVAKASNLLADELAVERGDVVRLALPPHWRTVYWALAAWQVGAVLHITPDVTRDDAAVLVTDRTDDGEPAADRLVAVSLPALARSWTGGSLGTVPLPSGAVDEAAELAGQPDLFAAVDEPTPDDDALVAAGQRLTGAAVLAAARQRAGDRGWSTGERVALTPGADQADADLLLDLLAAWSVDGSVVLVRDAEDEQLLARWQAERVTSAWAPPGTPASRPSPR